MQVMHKVCIYHIGIVVHVGHFYYSIKPNHYEPTSYYTLRHLRIDTGGVIAILRGDDADSGHKQPRNTYRQSRQVKSHQCLRLLDGR